MLAGLIAEILSEYRFIDPPEMILAGLALIEA